MKSPSNNFNETIVAISTPPGYSGIGVIRMSGPKSVSLLSRIFRPLKSRGEFPNRMAVYGRVVDPENNNTVDDGIAVVMKGPQSYTGEDMAEISLHGSPVVLDLVVNILIRLGARLAQKGEFTKRAFLSGKLDLIQAEAVIDLIESRSASAVSEARARLDRSVSAQIKEISDSLKDLLAEIEAHIDFDEDDEEPAPKVEDSLIQIHEKMNALKTSAAAVQARREGINTVIIGKPNVGKSTLFNALLKSDRMIVSPYPGTTRDPVDEHLQINQTTFILSDTAGIRELPDEIEKQGILRTRERIERADLLIVVMDASEPLDEQDAMIIHSCKNKRTILALNKTDLGMNISFQDGCLRPLTGQKVFISAKTGYGLDDLKNLMAIFGNEMIAPAERGGLNRRCMLLLEAASVPIEKLIEKTKAGERLEAEIISLEIRRALEQLEEMTGERVDDGILERIFERFCVGK